MNKKLMDEYEKIREKYIKKLTEECKAVVNYIIVTSDIYNYGKSLRDQKRELLNLNKINSILFLLQLCYVEKYGELAFKDEFYAGIYGPAIDRIYYEYNRLPSNDFHLSVISTNGVLSDEVKEILDAILVYTRQLSTNKLRDMVRRCELWYNVYDPNEKENRYRDVISNDDIIRYCQKYNDERKSDEKQLIKIKNQQNKL